MMGNDVSEILMESYLLGDIFIIDELQESYKYDLELGLYGPSGQLGLAWIRPGCKWAFYSGEA